MTAKPMSLIVEAGACTRAQKAPDAFMGIQVGGGKALQVTDTMCGVSGSKKGD
jgi:hypothetical protein